MDVFIFNGSADPTFRADLLTALGEVLHTLPTRDEFRTIAVQRTRQIRRWMDRLVAYDNRSTGRNQLSTSLLIRSFQSTDVAEHVVGRSYQAFRDHKKIFLTDHDMYGGDANWIYGSALPAWGYLTISNQRPANRQHRLDLLRHEVGHLFGAPSDNRTNIEENLGTHCTNRLCVMQQHDEHTNSARYSRRRAAANAATYCRQCIQDIRRHMRQSRRNPCYSDNHCETCGKRNNPDFLDTSHLAWRPYDMLYDHNRVPVITHTIPAGTTLYHGTARKDPIHSRMWFYFSPDHSKEFILNEEAEDAKLQLFEFTTNKPLDLVFIPSADRTCTREDYIAATLWLKAKYDATFAGLGYYRMAEAEAAICDAGADGLYLESDDSNYPSVMVCDPTLLSLTRVTPL